MPEVTVTGVNAISYPHVATWEWHIAVYLFLGGLVAGLMIFSSLFRLLRMKGFEKAILISDIVGLPLLGVGVLLLWIDLARRWNAWRFYATFQVTSPMSWGSWILLFCMGLLFLRLLTHIPMPDKSSGSNFFTKIWYGLWRFAARVGLGLARYNRAWDILALILGVALGLYTGVLLNTMPARPLWNSSVLPFLFLASGLAGGCAFLSLFLKGNQVHRLLPVSVTLGIVELALILAYVLTLYAGVDAAQRAGALLLQGSYAFALWGVVVLLGLLIPLAVEATEIRFGRVPAAVTKTALILVLAGGLALRFVVVYSGLQSSI